MIVDIFRFPGLLRSDDILSLLHLMASKSPIDAIAAKIVLDGGYDVCQKFPENDIFWSNIVGCDLGFIPDHDNGYCYTVLSTFENFDNGESTCEIQYDAELLLFDTNSQVEGFIELIRSGIFHVLKKEFLLRSEFVSQQKVLLYQNN